MVPILSLWLPIVISAVVVFFVSFLMWMVFPHHRPDWKKAPNEEGLRQSLGGQKLAPGQYAVPHCASPKEMKSAEWTKKMEEGPNAHIVVFPTGQPNVGKSMAVSFTFNLVVSIVVAYLAGRTLTADAEYLAVFRVVGTSAFLAYAGALFWGPIWFGRTWSSTFKEAFDGLVYALLTAGIFGSMWP